ncbi:hypothetical protein [Streptomyces goshikiensis]|uniref:hypothetical protein n=1 Tax=Streptomyces goshikiensis TaxID=1942 RepID=UPI0036DF4BC0
MIKNLMRRGLPAPALAALTLLTTTDSPAAANPGAPTTDLPSYDRPVGRVVATVGR